MKGRIINTPLSGAAQAVRDQWEFLRAMRSSREKLGTIANDQLARMLLERLCQDGQSFIDVGAHIGSVIDGVRRHSRPGNVVAVEAIPEKAAALRRKFPDVEIHCCAVGETSGETSFYVDVEQSGYSSLDRDMAGSHRTIREISVPIRRLDGLVAHKGIDVIKIDVEGAELGVLKGATGIISGSRPIVMFESGPRDAEGCSHEALWQWFEASDYAVVIPNRLAHIDSGLSLSGFVESHLYPRRTTNYFGVPRERRDQARARARQVLRLD